jgi:hypothetical protein
MNKAHNWQKKITLLNLLLAASISCYTFEHGASEILVAKESIVNYLETLIIPELRDISNIDALPLLRATCIKFIIMFRYQVPYNFLITYIDLCADYLKSSMIVTRSYAVVSIYKLTLKNKPNNENVLKFTNYNK